MQVEREHDERAGRSIWTIDQTHTTVEFEVAKFLFGKLRGRLVRVEGAVVLDEDVLAHSSVQATIKAGSIETNNARRDQHLRSAAFLDADRFPEITFQSTKVGPGKDRDMLSVKGELKIKGTSRELTLDVTEIDRSRSPQGEEVIYYVATTKLNRSELGVGGWFGLIGSTLNVVINVQAARKLS